MNKDGTIRLNGMDFDYPNEDELSKWDYKVYKEGKTTYYEIWLHAWERTNHSVARYSYPLVKTNRGSITLDGCRIKDKKECEEALKIFEGLKVFKT